MDELGYVKLARRIKSSWMIGSDHDALAVFIYLLTNVTHKPHKVIVDGQVIELRPGQVLGGRRRLAEACGLTEKQIRRILKLFENAEITAKQPANGRAKAVHVITFINWEFYQSDGSYGAKEKAKERTIEGPSKGQGRATDKNGNKGKKVNPCANADAFARFWEVYPKKRSKGDAEKAFAKINPDDAQLALMLQAIDQAKRSDDWQKDGGQFIPYPATWLNAKGWEDELSLDDSSVPDYLANVLNPEGVTA